MKENNKIKSINTKAEEFLVNTKSLSSDEKRIEATMVMEDIKSVDVDHAYAMVGKRLTKKFTIQRSLLILTRIAAILTLPLLAFVLWTLFLQNNHLTTVQSDVSWQEIQCPAGMRSHVVLPDGTDLWLNAESKIRYPIPFNQKTRQLELQGEAYLEVVHNENVPFILNAGPAKIKVLGTQFNVKAYEDEAQIEVALIEGSVEFTSTSTNGKQALATLSPNDYLKMDKSSGDIQMVSTKLDKYTSWRRNIIIFDETPMSEVAKTLERWYGVKVNISTPEINKYKFTTTFENESLYRVLELLELSSPSIKIIYNPGKINKQTNLASDSIVTIMKK